MSRQPIALSPDLQRLQNEGYDIDIRGGYLLVRDVPYVGADRTVRLGILISELNLSGNKTNKPGNHVAYWTGEHPCHSDGRKITAIENPSGPQNFYEGVQADFTFSAKADYRDYYHKITSYIARITGEATKLDPKADARTFPAIPTDEEKSPFRYVDTASSRAGIGAINSKVAGLKIGIAGQGGTGAYILDLVVKTEVAEIHIFDGDVFSQHNAFRAPGAPSLEELQAKPQKVHRLESIYSNMHTGIIVHDVFLDETNVGLLDGLDFVFICLDRGPIKQTVVERLVANGTPFVEVGMGVVVTDGKLGGIIRTVTSTPQTHEAAAPHISYADEDGNGNEYATNIQIAELNSLNAALAVIQWKKLFGVYHDLRNAVYTGYALPSGEIINEGAACPELVN
jgi:hypothetical protein